MLYLNLSVGYQNIEGLHSNLFGCKLESEINLTCDIEILSETWSSCKDCPNIQPPGYVLVKSIDSEKKGKKGRSSGGILVFCKTYLHGKVKKVKCSDKYIWFDIDNSLFDNVSQNIRVCAIYSQPVLSKYYRDSVWEDLELDITNFSSGDTPLFIIGDMNGRTGERSDFVCRNDRFIDNIPSFLIKNPRKSCDKIMNKIGEHILGLCKSYDLQIANGRSQGDFLGNFTHHNKNTGQSVVDLALISDALFPFMDDFKVLPQNTYSDHCKIVLTIKNLKAIPNPQTYEWQSLSPEYKWDSETSPLKFLEAFNLDEIKNLMNDCSQRIEAGLTESSGELLQEIFKKAAEISLTKKITATRSPKSKEKSKQKKWFDQECLELKMKSNKLANLKHSSPWNNSLLQTHRHVLKLFKKTCQKKKQAFWQEQYDDLDKLESNSDFWERWKFFGESRHAPSKSDLDGKKCEEFFEALFAKIDKNIELVMSKINTIPHNEFLNCEFIMEELKETIRLLISKKAVGPDRIANEFLKHAPPALLKILLRYFNLNIKKGRTCKSWCAGLIALIHKEGPKDDPNNYRGICIMNALLKVLCSLLNNRLKDYCNEKKLIDIAQIGFKEKSRASDHIFTLKSIVNKYVVDQKGKKLYTCFVDFKKAFDSVWHAALFRKLENKGINGNFLNIIKSIYELTECAVKIDNKTTKYFRYEKGVQQGNPLSPLLFNLFINDIFAAIKNDSNLTLDGVNNLNALMYADDLIIMATSPEELQKSLDGLSAYCAKWKLDVNVKKTKCLTFSKGSNCKKFQFKINHQVVENVKEYKYLGINVNAKNCSFGPSLINLSAKATRALYAITSKLPVKNAPVRTLMKLFDFCVAPILTYGSETWAAYLDYDSKSWDQTPIEKCHTQFLKRLLGVNRSATNVMVRSEFGRNSLQERITKRNLKYIQYISSKDDQSLVWHAMNYELTQIDKRKTIFSLFQRHGEKLLSFADNLNIENTDADPTILEKINSIEDDKMHSSIKNCFNSLWKEEIADFPKADTFRQFKDEVKFERYLEDVSIRKHRVSLSKLRISDHCLMIERGRYSRPAIPRGERYCPHCPLKLEDEEHFLTQCTAYDRSSFFTDIDRSFPQFHRLDLHSKFIYLMSQEDKALTKDFAGRVHRWLTSRLEFEAQQKEIENAMSTI